VIFLPNLVAIVVCERVSYRFDVRRELCRVVRVADQKVAYSNDMETFFDLVWPVISEKRGLSNESRNAAMNHGRRIMSIRQEHTTEPTVSHYTPIRVDPAFNADAFSRRPHLALHLENGVTIVFIKTSVDPWRYDKSVVQFLAWDNEHQKYQCVTPPQSGNISIRDAVVCGPDSFVFALSNGMIRYQVSDKGAVLDIKRYACATSADFKPCKLVLLRGHEETRLLAITEDLSHFFNPEKLILSNSYVEDRNNLDAPIHNRGVTHIHVERDVMVVFHKVGFVVFQVNLVDFSLKFIVFQRYTMQNRREYEVVGLRVSITDECPMVVLLRGHAQPIVSYQFRPFSSIAEDRHRAKKLKTGAS
jgi:hypothetical protein